MSYVMISTNTKPNSHAYPTKTQQNDGEVALEWTQIGLSFVTFEHV